MYYYGDIMNELLQIYTQQYNICIKYLHLWKIILCYLVLAFP